MQSIKISTKKFFARILNKNTVGAYLLQVDKGLFALVLLPLLASRLGISVFGIFTTFLSLGSIAWILVDWGFSQVAVHSIAIVKDHEKSHIASTVIFARLILALPVSLVVCALFFLNESLGGHQTLLLCVILTIFAVSVSPVFLFQAEEKSFAIGVVLLVVRMLELIFMIIFINNPEDLNLAYAIHLCSTCVGIGFGWKLLIFKYQIRIILIGAREACKIILVGFNFAFANIGSSLYGSGSAFLLSLVSSSEEVGIFSLAMNLTRGLGSIITTLAQSSMPSISRLHGVSLTKAIKVVRKALILQMSFALAIVFITWFVLNQIQANNFYPNHSELLGIISVLSPTIVATSVSSMLVLFVIIPMDSNLFYRNLVIATSLLGSACLLCMGYFFQGYGAALSITIVELSICIVIFYHSLKLIGRNLS